MLSPPRKPVSYPPQNGCPLRGAPQSPMPIKQFGLSAADVRQQRHRMFLLTTLLPTSTSSVERALTCTRCVSSAHASKFSSSGAVVLRSALAGHEADIDLCAAALAARLLNVKACCVAAPPPEEGADIGMWACMPHSADSSTAAALNLHVGDVLAVSPEMWIQEHTGAEEPLWFSAANSQTSDREIVWADPFYGGRGSAPTDVTQWSKGTIHHPVE